MIAYGHLSGSSVDPHDPKRRLIDHVVTTVCNCLTGTPTDESVQLQIIKVFNHILKSMFILISKNVFVLKTGLINCGDISACGDS